jgi:ribA/ribD-fused uncharacterized protein
MTIRFYSQSATYREFSNFAPFPIELDGEHWPTSEHYYQAQKFIDPAMQAKIRAADKPIVAKNIADNHRDRMRPDWDAVKDAVMDRAVRQKFALHPALRALLLATGDEPIAEDGPNRDGYWGLGGDGQGLNKLGRIVERIRADLRANPTRVV